jgi:glyceraldehyde-3-phosphate dehydrogenase/erythrose-4-phosphate dehydrogenase
MDNWPVWCSVDSAGGSRVRALCGGSARHNNEWGYSARLVDFAAFMAGKGFSMEK